jgi:hypothetical protein
MGDVTKEPQPSHEVREAMLHAYDLAAATNPRACNKRVIDASGKCRTLTEKEYERRKEAAWPSGVLPPPL